MGSDPKGAKGPLLELDDPGSPASVRNVNAPSDVHADATASHVRERMPTVTDEVALEQARLQSFPTNIPPPRRPMSTLPGPITAATRDSSRDSAVEIDAGDLDLESLGPDEQIAILRARLSPETRIPQLAQELSQLGSLLQDPKTAYILGFVDGILPLETIVEVTGLPELDTLRVLDRMVAQSVIVFR